MNLRSVDLNLLTIFDAISIEQNLSRAADRIGMTQPAVSAALGRLRLEFKDDLFVRTGRGVKPTPRAMELQHQVRDILARVRAILTQAQNFDPKQSSRTFNLASIDYGGIVIIPSLMEYLDNRDYSVKINIWPQYDINLKEMMRFGTVDFAIDNVPITDSDFSNEVLHRETAWCLVRKNHPRINNKLTMKKYLEAEHVALFPQGDQVSELDEYLIARGMRRNVSIKAPSFFNMPYIVKGTNTICTLPKRLALHFAQLHGLKALEVPLDDWEGHFYLMWHSRLDSDLAHRWLRETIITLSSSFSSQEE